MDIKEYISSGILEQYVLNATSEQERQEVECMSHIYPEIKTALSELQTTIENYVQTQAIEPPKELKAKILGAVSEESQNKIEREGEVVSMKATAAAEKSGGNFGKFGVAASVLLLVGMTVLFFVLNNKVETLQTAVDTRTERELILDNQIADLKNELDSAAIQRANNESLLAELSSSATQKINLSGTDLSPESKVNVFWNQDSKNVYMSVEELPQAPTDKQYQLWAIVDGAPTDMGLVSLDGNDSITLMPYLVEDAQAFAITLENAGGSTVPTLTDLYVIGNV